MIRMLFIVFCLLFVAPAVRAQGATAEQTPAEEQNEAMLDTLKRMQIKREENDHKKLLEKAAQIKDDIESLAKAASISGNLHLPRASDKKLKDIEKSARQIRSESGGSQDQPLESPPSSLAEAIEKLRDASERLNSNLSKTSRRVVSISVVGDATDIIQLARILREYIN